MKSAIRVLGALSLLSPSVMAQGTNAEPKAPVAPDDGSSSASDEPASPSSGESEESAPEAQPQAEPRGPQTKRTDGRGIPVEDELLEPVPPPENVLEDWRDALKHVKTRSPDLLSAHAQIEAARGQSRMALAGALPRLRGFGNVNHHLATGQGFNPGTGMFGTIPDPRTTWNTGASLSVPLLSARNWYDYATSKDEIERAELQAEDAERLIIGALAEAIVTVVTTERLAEITRVNLTAALSNLELNKRRARLGSGNAVDVLRAKQEVVSSRSQVVEADEALRKAREALGRAMGYSEPWGVTPNLKLDQLRADARNTCQREEDLKNRADLRAAAAGAAIAERNVKSVMYDFLPTVDLTSTFTYFSFNNFTNQKPYTWTIGGTLTWHLYDGGLRYGERRLNEALLVQSQQSQINAELGAQQEVVQATRGVDVARQSLEIAKDSQGIADDNATLAKTKFINGTGTSFDMVDTQRTARQSKIDVAVKEFELLRAEIIAFLALASCKI